MIQTCFFLWFEQCQLIDTDSNYDTTRHNGSVSLFWLRSSNIYLNQKFNDIKGKERIFNLSGFLNVPLHLNDYILPETLSTHKLLHTLKMDYYSNLAMKINGRQQETDLL